MNRAALRDQVTDIGIMQSEAWWRRAFLVMLLLALVTSSTALVEATTSHVEAVIYREDISGDIALTDSRLGQVYPTEMATSNTNLRSSVLP